MISLMIRIFRQIGHDPRSLAMLLFAPLLVLSLLFFLLGDSSYQPTIIASGLPAPIYDALGDEAVTLTEADADLSLTAADQLLADGQTDAVILYTTDGITIRMHDADSVKSEKIIKALRAAMATVAPQNSMTLTTIYGDPDANMFNSMGYIFLGILSFFFVYLIAGIAFVRERTTGTLERLMMTPIHRWQIVGGYFLGLGLFASIQSILIVLFTHTVLGMPYLGPLPAAMLVMVLLSLTAVALGAVVSSLANNEFQVVQTIPIIIVPQIFFTGLIPIDTLPFGLGNLAYIMPVYYGCEGLKAILTRGETFGGIFKVLLGLLIILIVLFVANTLVLKKYRKT